MSSATSGQSKPKNKQKKSQEMIELEQKIETLMRENIELQITVQKLNDRATLMKKSQMSQETRHNEQHEKAQRQVERLEIYNKARDEHIQKLAQKKDQFEIENGCLNYQIEKLKKQIEEYKLNAKHQYEDLKRYTENQIKKYEQVVSDYQTAIDERVEYLSHNQSLQNQLQATREEEKKHIADKDRDKLQSIDFLKRELQQKVKQLKSNLLSMRRQQMATNTRITVLQNHQLLEELEYQSKHTQKVLKQNTELERRVDELRKELEVEKEMVGELAKRSAVGKKIIKTLNERNGELQKSVEKGVRAASSLHKTQAQSSNSQQTVKKLSKTLLYAQKQLLSMQEKLNKAHQEKNYFQHLYESNQPKYEYYLKHEGDLRLLMVRFLSHVLNGQMVGEEGDVQYDLSRLRDVPVEQWEKSDVEITVRMLLTFIRPHLVMKNLQTDFIKHKASHLSSHANYIDQLTSNPQPESYLINKTKQKRFTSKAKSFSSANLHSAFNISTSKDNISTNVSPGKKPKDISLFSALQEFKRKSLSRKDKTISQHNLTDLNTVSVEVTKFKHATQIKQNLIQTHGFKPQQFKKDKQMSKLIRTNIRDWGKNVEVHQKTHFLLKPK